jgi:hypothetical protein
MKTFEIKRSSINVEGAPFSDCYSSYRATTRAVEALLPQDHYLCDDLWLHEGKIEHPIYLKIDRPEGFSLQEYRKLKGYLAQEEQELDGLAYWLPMNGNWSIMCGADTFSTKYAKLITTVYQKVGTVVIPAK